MHCLRLVLQKNWELWFIPLWYIFIKSCWFATAGNLVLTPPCCRHMLIAIWGETWNTGWFNVFIWLFSPLLFLYLIAEWFANFLKIFPPFWNSRGVNFFHIKRQKYQSFFHRLCFCGDAFVASCSFFLVLLWFFSASPSPSMFAVIVNIFISWLLHPCMSVLRPHTLPCHIITRLLIPSLSLVSFLAKYHSFILSALLCVSLCVSSVKCSLFYVFSSVTICVVS